MEILGGKQHAKYLKLENGQSFKTAMCMADDNNENDKGTFTRIVNIQTNRVSLTDRIHPNFIEYILCKLCTKYSGLVCVLPNANHFK